MNHLEIMKDFRAIEARNDARGKKHQRGDRLSAKELREQHRDIVRLRELFPLIPEARFLESRAAVSEQIRDAVKRGIAPRITSEPGGLVPPPPGYDPLA